MRPAYTGAVGHPLPAATPSLAAMKSGPLTTPARFNPLLPKTPAGGMARRPRRGEVLYAVSANGSPILGCDDPVGWGGGGAGAVFAPRHDASVHPSPPPLLALCAQR
jgi:hypothetical protein